MILILICDIFIQQTPSFPPILLDGGPFLRLPGEPDHKYSYNVGYKTVAKVSSTLHALC